MTAGGTGAQHFFFLFAAEENESTSCSQCLAHVDGECFNTPKMLLTPGCWKGMTSLLCPPQKFHVNNLVSLSSFWRESGTISQKRCSFRMQYSQWGTTKMRQAHTAGLQRLEIFSCPSGGILAAEAIYIHHVGHKHMTASYTLYPCP